MRALLTRGANPQLPMKDGTTPLMAAAGVGARNSQNRRGRTVIDGAKLEPEVQVVEAVSVALSPSTDINALDLAGNTALHGAVSMGYDEVVRLLVEKGAQLNIKNKRGQTPLAQASSDPALSHTADLLRKLGAAP